MRPFFTAIKPRKACSTNDEFLSAENWRLDLDSASFPGTPPGRGSEFSNDTHPHLQLDITMTSVPAVQPGDHVFWHCGEPIVIHLSALSRTYFLQMPFTLWSRNTEAKEIPLSCTLAPRP